MNTTRGIDLGTSELKLALVAAQGALIATAGAPLTVSVPHPHVLPGHVAALCDAERGRAPLFMPHLSGERTPHDDPHPTGAFFGMDDETDAARPGHAVIEGVGFGLADGRRMTVDGAEAGGAVGAGRLAWLSLDCEPHEVCRPPTPRVLFTPRAPRRPALRARLERLRELYRRTRDLLPRS